jgi:hypothetical protein
MVSMNRAPKTVPGDLRIVLARHFAASNPRDLSKVFAAWLLGEPEEDVGFASIVKDAALRDGAQQAFQTVAILGFAAQAGVLARTQIDAFKSGLRRHAGREPVVERLPMAFMSDAVGIFGIAIGARAIADAEIIGELGGWSTKFLRTVYEMERTADWERCLLAVADRQFHAPHLSVPDSAAVSDVRVALAKKGLIDIADSSEGREDDLRALVLAVQQPAAELDCDRTALRLAALNAIIATVAGQFCVPTCSARAGPRAPRSFEASPRPSPASSTGDRELTRADFPSTKETPSTEARAAKETRAMTVAKLIKELDTLRPQMLEDESEYIRLREIYEHFLAFRIAEQRPDLKVKILAIRGSTRHIRLAQELAGAHHGRQLSTIQDDWKDFKPAEFKRSR